MTNSIPHFIRNFLIGVPLAVFVSVFLLETLVRLLALAPPLETRYNFFVSDPALPFKLRPNSTITSGGLGGEFSFLYQHNSFGLRDREQAFQKQDGVFRILGLGDSFTYGDGAAFEDTYLARLERALNEDYDRPVEIIKAGIPRYFPEAERLLLEHVGLQFSPDLVMVAFTPNDLPETYLGLEAVAPHPEHGFLMTKEARMLGEPGIFLFRNSHTFRLLWTHKVSNPLWFDPHLNPFSLSGREGEVLRQVWQKVFAEYSRMAELAHDSGAAIVFVYLPFKGPPWPEEAARYLEQWCRQEGHPFINLLPAMRTASQEKILYWEKDMHCNAAGYAVIAAELARQLPALGLY